MSTFTLKWIALILMTIDHIGVYFEGSPMWFRLLGRGSYPLFLFCMVWGYHYTSNRKKYLLRLYFMGIFMAVFGYVINTYFINGYGNHNIFVPMLLVGILISTIEVFCKDKKKGLIMLSAIFGGQILYYIILLIFPFVSSNTLTAFIPNLVLNEYGFQFIALGVLMYFLKEKKSLLFVMYVLFCINQFSAEMMEINSFNQSFMIIALPFMLYYNNQKGNDMKYFFYFFYPAHTVLLFYLGRIL